MDFIPPSVVYGDRRKKFAWRVLGWREALAFRLAPWVKPPPLTPTEAAEAVNAYHVWDLEHR